MTPQAYIEGMTRAGWIVTVDPIGNGFCVTAIAKGRKPEVGNTFLFAKAPTMRQAMELVMEQHLALSEPVRNYYG